MRLNKIAATTVSLLCLAAILYSIRENWQEKPRDNFPLSYFPMFSHKRDSVMNFNYLVGYDSMGHRWAVPYRFVGSGGFNQVRRQINKKVRQDKGDKLCEKVAKRLKNCTELPYSELTRVDLVTGAYHLDDYFLRSKKLPVHEKIIASEKIERQ
jgi:hypothetical protein